MPSITKLLPPLPEYIEAVRSNQEWAKKVFAENSSNGFGHELLRVRDSRETGADIADHSFLAPHKRLGCFAVTIMRIVVIADTHGLHDHFGVPDGDMLIVAGDFTNTGKSTQVARAAVWLGSLPHKHKIVVAGNHDFYFEREPAHAAALLAERGITYLQDTGVHVEGLLIYGSPWQPAFMNWAFNVPRGRLGGYWEQIPSDLDILITHGPPFGVLDQAIPGRTDHVGCEELLASVQKTKPRVHVFGHIHGSYGTTKNEHTTFYNASLANERYEIVNPAWVFDLEKR